VAASALTDGTLSIRWRAGSSGQTYRFQLADEPGFAAPRIDAVTALPEFVLPAPAAGVYFLRVATIDSDGHSGAFGSVQTIEIPSPAPPAWLWLALPLLLGLLL
jgi:hypothetical protein